MMNDTAELSEGSHSGGDNSKMKQKLIRILSAAALLTAVLLCCVNQESETPPAAPPDSSVSEDAPQTVPSADPAVSQTEPTEYPVEIEPGQETFSASPLTDDVIAAITGISWKENRFVSPDDLSLLTISYVGFDGKRYTGQMIAAREVADELTDIFRELYEQEFPIERIRLIDAYGADDNASMADNNTSAFCYREIAGTDWLSNHSFGLAVDINPVQNPYIREDLVQPEAGQDYLDRENVRPGMIVPGNACYNAFTARGWTWGGSWSEPIDYQHFEKT